jgi:hypothetical protein
MVLGKREALVPLPQNDWRDARCRMLRIAEMNHK